MNSNTIKDIYQYLEDVFKDSPKRLMHINLVKDKALKLARIYGADLDKVEIAALLHDSTKLMPDALTMDWAKQVVNFEDIKCIPKGCLHAYSAAYLARNKFLIDDLDVINAIIYHCSGKKNMSLLEQIIYVSDFIEPSRTFVDDELRLLAENDLNKATLLIIQKTIAYLEKHQQYVSNLTYEAYAYYQKIVGGTE